jgi:hypothetical protein
MTEYRFFNRAKYDMMWQRVLQGLISEEEWEDYCFSVLGELLDENKDVLFRMQNEWANVQTGPSDGR